MRATLLLSALTIASVAAAQRPADYREGLIWDAYSNFRANDYIKLDMKGSDTVGKVTTPVHVIVYYRLSNDPRTGKKTQAEVEVDTYTATNAGEILTMRIVGDGKTLYRYDLTRMEVTSTTYGYYGNIAPAGYAGSDAPKLFSQLRAQTPGSAAYAVRLLREFNPAGSLFGPFYNDWLPGRSHLLFDEVPLPLRKPTSVSATDTVTDPVTGKVFARGGDTFVFYGLDRVDTDRSVSFELYDADNDPNNGSELWEIYTMTVGLRSANRLLALEVKPTFIDPLNPVFPTGTFVPYSGAAASSFRPINRGQ